MPTYRVSHNPCQIICYIVYMNQDFHGYRKIYTTKKLTGNFLTIFNRALRVRSDTNIRDWPLAYSFNYWLSARA